MFNINLSRIQAFALEYKPSKTSPWSLYCASIANSNIYRDCIFFVVCVDTIRMLYEADLLAQSEYITISPAYYWIQSIKLVSFSIYVLEMVIRISAMLDEYFYNCYNLVDMFVLLDIMVVWILSQTYPYFSSYVGLRLLRGLQILRIFRLIPLITSLELVVNALLYTMITSVMDVIYLTLMAIFIFGNLGHYSFGTSNPSSPAYADWSTLPSSFLTIWIYICGDNWLPYQDRLRESGYTGSQVFSIILIFVGNFMISNLFIGVISQNVYEASQAERLQVLQQQRDAKLHKRDLFLKKQQRDLLQLVQQKTLKNGEGFQEIIRSLAGTLRHDELLPAKQLSMNLLWLETLVLALHYHENSRFRSQQTHFAIAHSLAELIEKRLANKGF